MWSDQGTAEQIRALISKLHSVLPAPQALARTSNTTLQRTASFEQVSELLHAKPGFIYLKSGPMGPCLLHNPLVTISYKPQQALIRGPEGSASLEGFGFDILQAAVEAWPGASGAMLAGFVAYDLAAEIEDLGPLPHDALRFPTLHFGLYDSVLSFDGSQWSLTSTDAWRASPIAETENLLHRAAQIVPNARMLSPSASTSQPIQAEFEASVERIVATIHAGDIFQTNLCRRIEAHCESELQWQLFQRMRAINPAQYEAFLKLDAERALMSISPEMFLKADEGVVESRPIKGTRPRGDTREEDATLAAQLVASEKDRAELAMIVDVVRNDLARVCLAGSIEVTEHAALMSLPTVHHLFSTVRGRLREGQRLTQLLRAAFPAASISGAPKIEAMRVAMREEGQQRGPCMGAIGWISLEGRMELSVAIRTAFAERDRVLYYAGCGITAESNPQEEYRESSHKAAAFLRALSIEPD